MMGSPADEAERSPNETQHEVTISRAFYLGKYEVTQEEYQAMTGTNPFALAKRVAVPLLVGIAVVVALRMCGVL